MKYAVKMHSATEVFGFKTFGTLEEAKSFKQWGDREKRCEYTIYKVELVPVEIENEGSGDE